MMKKEVLACHPGNTCSNVLGKVVVKSELVTLENRPLYTIVGP